MKHKDWNDIPVKKWYEIRDILQDPDDYTALNLIDLIYDIDSANLSIQDFGKYSGALDFLNTEIPTINLDPTYTINGTTYNTNYNLSTVTAAQFIDYQNYKDANKWEDYMSIVFIPEGHTYNDGYDMEKVKKDILDMPITFVKSLVFFYTLQLNTFATHFLSSFKQTVKKMNLTKEQETKVLNELKIVEQTLE